MPKNRNLGPTVENRIAARAVVAPYLTKIGPLVDRAVFLETIGRQGHLRRPDLRGEAAMLANEAREDLKHLDRQLAGLSAEVLADDGIADARRALVAVVDRFERAKVSL